MKTILITGGTNGIGLAALKKLVQENYFPLLICRSEEKAKQTLKILGKGRYYLCELSETKSVLSCCQDILVNESSIDFFIANAGVIGFDKETKTAEGLEMTSQVNYYSHFLMVQKLHPLFERCKTRLIFTASVMHKSKWHSNYDFTKGINISPYSPFKAYARSKACLVCFAAAYAKQNPMNAVFLADPGVVGTGIMRSRGKLMNTLFFLAKPFFSSAEKGAAVLINALKYEHKQTAEALYLLGAKQQKFHALAQDEKVQEELLRQSHLLLPF